VLVQVVGLLSKLNGIYWLAACRLYGSRLRLMACMRLRVKDIDFDRLSITVREETQGQVLNSEFT
jgi:integrase